MKDTQQLIKECFIELYGQGYSKMNIRQLCQSVPIARTTFYSYYQNLDEVLNEIEDDFINGLYEIIQPLQTQNPRQEDFSLLFDQIYPYLLRHSAMLRIFLIQEPNYRLIKKWKNAIKLHLSFVFPQQKLNPNWPLISEMIASSVISAYIFGIEHEQEFAIKTLKQQIYSFVATISTIL